MLIFQPFSTRFSFAILHSLILKFDIIFSQKIRFSLDIMMMNSITSSFNNNIDREMKEQQEENSWNHRSKFLSQVASSDGE